MPGATLTVRGVAVPRLGLGTWRLSGRACEDAVRDALELGYRHIDTARMYGNEREVGRAIAAAGLGREEIFLTTKIWPDDLAPARLRPAAEASLRELGLDFVDLLLIHWPNEDVPLADTLGAMSALAQAGRARLIGVSNFPPRLLTKALELAPVACDQMPFDPFRRQEGVLAVARDHDLFVCAYSPLARGRVTRDSTLRAVAEAHGATPAQVALRWLLDQGPVAVIPKASSHERRAENLGALGLALTDEERARIDDLAGR